MVIKEGSYMYENWKTTPIPLRFELWVFDVANVDEVLAGGTPFVAQKGPYTYWQYRRKENITFNDNGTVAYDDIHTWYFDRSLSVGDDTDTFTNIDIPVLASAYILRYEYSLIKESYKLLRNGVESPLFITLSVRDIMFGYPDPFLTVVTDIFKEFGVDIIDNHIGLFYNKNGTTDSTYTAFTGAQDISHVGMIDTWNHMKTLPFWSNAYANMINGSDGVTYGPLVDKSKRIYAFSSDACRTVYLDFDSDSSLKGIDCYHYKMPLNIFSPDSVVPDNIGFCTPADHCLPSGLLNVTGCRYGGPISISHPHFNGADPSVQAGVSGLYPTEDMHSDLQVEPVTGIGMSFGMKFQINQALFNTPLLVETEKMKPTIIPLLWFNESGLVTDEIAANFRSMLVTPLRLVTIVQYSLIGLGSVLLIVAITAILITRRQRQQLEKSKIQCDEKSPLINAGSETHATEDTYSDQRD